MVTGQSNDLDKIELMRLRCPMYAFLFTWDVRVMVKNSLLGHAKYLWFSWSYSHVLDMINLVGTSTSYGKQDWLWFIVISGTLLNCNDHHFSFLKVLLW